MESLRSRKSVSKVILTSNNQEQLKIFSKRHSLTKEEDNSLSVSEDMSAILNVLEAFDNYL
jgi:hypothetical protein